MATLFPASKFRSAKAAAILRSQAAEHSDFNLQAWTEQAAEDLSGFIHLEHSANGNERRTYGSALNAVREGVALFADCFHGATREERRSHGTCDAWHDFSRVRFEDIKFLARNRP